MLLNALPAMFYLFINILSLSYSIIHVQWNLSIPTHQGTKEMCRIVQDVGKLRFSFWLTEIFTNLTWGRN
jgi:hypothetical protein